VQHKLRTAIPLDFIPKTRRLTKEELEDRKLFWAALDKRTNLDENGTPNEELKEEKLKEKIFALRSVIFALSRSRINRVFVERLLESFPGLNSRDGRKIECIKDFAEYVKYAPLDNALRAVVFYAEHGMWGTCNDWADELEDEIMDLLMLKYTGKLCNGEKKMKVHDGGCIKRLIIKYRHILIEAIRNVMVKVHKEDYNVRNCHKPKETENDSESDLEDFDAKMTPLRKSKKGLVDLVKAEQDKHGFFGYLGMYKGHPSLQGSALVTPPPKSAAKKPEDPYFAWFNAKCLAGEIQSFEDIQRLAEAELSVVRKINLFIGAAQEERNAMMTEDSIHESHLSLDLATDEHELDVCTFLYRWDSVILTISDFYVYTFFFTEA
jgi:hypothetical protein